MIKHLTIPVLGLAILVGAVAPAAADRGGYWVKSGPRYGDAYAYEVQPQKKATNQRRKFNPKLDFETEAVWRNLRPEWFVGGN